MVTWKNWIWTMGVELSPWYHGITSNLWHMSLRQKEGETPPVFIVIFPWQNDDFTNGFDGTNLSMELCCENHPAKWWDFPHRTMFASHLRSTSLLRSGASGGLWMPSGAHIPWTLVAWWPAKQVLNATPQRSKVLIRSPSNTTVSAEMKHIWYQQHYL